MSKSPTNFSSSPEVEKNPDENAEFPEYREKIDLDENEEAAEEEGEKEAEETASAKMPKFARLSSYLDFDEVIQAFKDLKKVHELIGEIIEEVIDMRDRKERLNKLREMRERDGKFLYFYIDAM